MKKTCKQTNGFKFSFKDPHSSAKSTPKFTSIELRQNQLRSGSRRTERAGYSTPTQQPEGKPIVKNKIKKQREFTPDSTIMLNKSYYEKNEGGAEHFLLSEKIEGRGVIKSVYSAKKLLGNEAPQLKQYQNQFQAYVREIRAKDMTESRKHGPAEEESTSYLKLYRQQKKPERAKSAISRNSGLKKYFSLFELITDQNLQTPKKLNSPKSAKSTQKKLHTIETRFISKKQQIEIINSSLFPETERSRKLFSPANCQQDSPSSKINFSSFRKVQPKRNANLSKGMFKAKNLMVKEKLGLLNSTLNKSRLELPLV